MEDEKLIFRLNRIIGQLEGLKKQVNTHNPDQCLKVMYQLKASINGLKKFGEAYMAEHVDTCVQDHAMPPDVQNRLKSVISGAFSL